MRQHWFSGTGMVHGVRLREGRAEWHRNRFVRDADGNAGRNTAADHLSVLDRSLTEILDRCRSKNVLIRADGAGHSHALIVALSEPQLEFSVGDPVTDAVRDAIALVPTWAWQSAINADGGLRQHADVIEVTQLLELSRWTRTCPGMRVIVRRELPHLGATLDAFEIRDGFRYQAFTTNTARGQLAFPARRGSRTGSGPARTPASVTCRPGKPESIGCGSSWC